MAYNELDVLWSGSQTLASGIDYLMPIPKPQALGKLRFVARQQTSSAVKLLMHMNGAATDSSPTGATFTATGATYSSSIKKYGSHSADFTGGSGTAYLQTASTAWALGTRFTVSAQLYMTAFAANSNYISTRDTSDNLGYEIQITGTGTCRFVPYGGGSAQATTGTLTLNAWNEVCWTGDGTTIRCYINKSLNYSAAFTTSVGVSGQRLRLGRSTRYAEQFSGYLDEVRIISGYAVPPSSLDAAFPTPETYDWSGVPVSNLSASSGVGALYVGDLFGDGNYYVVFRNLTGNSGTFQFGVGY